MAGRRRRRPLSARRLGRRPHRGRDDPAPPRHAPGHLRARRSHPPWHPAPPGGPPTGGRSTRLAVGLAVAPGRTAPVHGAGRCPDEWTRYALDARVMLVRASDREHVPVTDGLDFQSWIADGHPLGWPTRDDLDYHLTTLFPPVRPRGWLELRMIDALPDPWWRVAVVVSARRGAPPAPSRPATPTC